MKLTGSKSRAGFRPNFLLQVWVLLALMGVISMPEINTLAQTSPHYYFVSPSGSNSNPGTITKPFLTIGKAASVVVAGDTVYIREGVYNESVAITRSGTATDPIIFRAYPYENPVIDGYNTKPGVGGYLLGLLGDYIHVSGIEVRNSAYFGIYVYGNYDLVDDVYVHHSWNGGVLISHGSHSTVQNSRVWRNALENEYANSPTNWAFGLVVGRQGVNYATIRNNHVWENWGEGISSFEADHTVMEDNTAHDNFSTNIYISDSTNVICQRNLVYMNPASYAYGYGSNVGIMMGDEKYTPPSANIQVLNNIAYNNYRNFFWWQGVQGGGMNNVLIAYNTFVNATGYSQYGQGNVIIGSGTHSNVRFMNNLVLQEDSLPVIATIAQPGVTYSHNLWSKTPLAAARGTGDVIGNPLLEREDTPFTPQWFRISDGSPALNAAVVLGEINTDYFQNSRGSLPDMGAIEGVYIPVDVTVSLTGTGSGTVTSSPAGISCGADCSESFAPDTSVTLVAQTTPIVDGYNRFVGWGGACSGSGVCTLTESGSVTAEFEQVIFSPAYHLYLPIFK